MYFLPRPLPLPTSPLWALASDLSLGSKRACAEKRAKESPGAAYRSPSRSAMEHWRKDNELSLAPCCPHNVFMIPKPIQFLLLLPLAFGPVAPRFFLGLFALGLVALVLWCLRLVVAMALGK